MRKLCASLIIGGGLLCCGGASAQAAQGVESSSALFQKLLLEPDRVDLNAAYIRAQIAEGHLQPAAAALERLLLLHPEADELRLLYAILLVRLDDPSTAQQELGKIVPDHLTPARRQEYEAITHVVTSRQQRLRQAVTAGWGLHQDSNRNSAPSSNQVLMSDLPFTVQGQARRQSDAGQRLSLGYEADYDLGKDPRQSLYLNAQSMIDHQFDLHRYDMQAGTIETGLHGAAEGWDWQGGLLSTQLGLGGGYYLNEDGVVVRLSRRLSPAWDLGGDARLSHQRFHAVATDPAGGDYSGWEREGWLTLRYLSPDWGHWSAGLGMRDRLALAHWLSAHRDAVRVGDTLSLSYGQIVNLSAEAGLTRYHLANLQISPLTRRDQDLKLAMTYAVPFGGIADWGGWSLPDDLRGVTLSLRQEMDRTVSNLTNYTTTNLRSEILLTQRWEY